MQSVVEGLSAIPGRGACTDAERRAALWLHDELRSRGHEAWVETRWVRPQRYATIVVGALLAVAGGLLSTVAAVAGLVVAVAGAAVLALEVAGWALPLFPRRATQHVVTEADEPSLVIAAAYDAPRRGLVLNDRWRRRLRPRWGLAACGVAVAACAGARVGGVEATWLGAVQLVPTVVLLVAFAAAVDITLSGFSPGANDNASGVAVALALHDELRRDGVPCMLVLLGAGHAVPRVLAAERIRGPVQEIGPVSAERAHQADDTPEHVSDAALEAALSAAVRDASPPG
jgi:hypothetical protein